METKLRIKGRVHAVVVDAYGNIVRERLLDNLVVNGGLGLVAGYLAGESPAVPVSHIAIGDGQTPPALSDTTLENELIRAAADVTKPQNNVVQYRHIWAFGTATGTYYEAGLFDADADGNLFSRVTFPELIVEDIHQLIVTWTITVTATEVI
jgi:hypothetical protein